MNRIRPVVQVTRSTPTVEGAGVRLRRAFGFPEQGEFDPFLLLDDFRADNPAHFRAGFPWHPHRGIETITYVLEGDVEHGDSLGHAGSIGAGDVQWMTAGSGIVHQEMPHGNPQGRMGGFQLWANLPASHKMMDPRYREVLSAEIPELTVENGVTVRVICGEVAGVSGPVRDIVTDPQYLDVAVPAGAFFGHAITAGHTAFAYVFEGAARFGDQDAAVPLVASERLVRFGDGETIVVTAGAPGARFLLVSGRPLREPIAWHGPIVMNTREELRQAFEEYERGTFVKVRGGGVVS